MDCSKDSEEMSLIGTGSHEAANEEAEFPGGKHLWICFMVHSEEERPAVCVTVRVQHTASLTWSISQALGNRQKQCESNQEEDRRNLKCSTESGNKVFEFHQRAEGSMATKTQKIWTTLALATYSNILGTSSQKLLNVEAPIKDDNTAGVHVDTCWGGNTIKCCKVEWKRKNRSEANEGQTTQMWN